MSTRLKATTLRPFLLLALSLLSGCATNFEPLPLSTNHPANAQAQEAPRRGSTRLIGKDAITRKTIAQLERTDAATPDLEGAGMSHDMSSMSGMDHSKMPGMDMKREPASAPAKPADVDHSKMPGMTMPAAATAESPASKEAAEAEMKKTSDEMKKLSDKMKAKSDAEKPTTKPSGKPSQAPKSEAAYWTCVMHAEIHADKPGQCPKCGMTLVKKEGGAK